MHHAFQPPRHLGFVPPAPAPADPGFFTCVGPAARQLPTSPAIAAPLGSTLCGPSRLDDPIGLPRLPTRPSHLARRLHSTNSANLHRRPLLPPPALRVPALRGHAPRRPTTTEPRLRAHLHLPLWTPGFLTCEGPCGSAAPNLPCPRGPPPGSTLCGSSRLGNPTGLPRSPARPNPIPFHGPPRPTLPACPARFSRPASVTPPGPPRTSFTAHLDHLPLLASAACPYPLHSSVPA